MARLLLMELSRPEIQTNQSRVVNQAAEWIRMNSDLPLKASEVARHFGYHPDYFNRLFRRYYQKSLKEYLDEARIQWLKAELLTANASLGQIAAAAGFSEYKYFLKYFKYHEGMTPTEFCEIYSKSHWNNR